MTLPVDSTPPSNGNAKAGGHWLWSVFFWTIFIAILGYNVYSIGTRTGLAGYLISLQIRIFGGASLKMTTLFSLLISAVAASPFIWLAQKMLSSIIGPGAGAAAMRIATSLNSSPVGGYKWKWIVVAGLVPLVLGMLVAVPLYWLDQRDRFGRGNQTEAVYALDLTSADPVLPKGTTRIEIKGLVRGNFAAGYGERPAYKFHWYVPVTGPNWKATDPVQYVLHRSVAWAVGENGKTAQPNDFTQLDPVTSYGSLGTQLPATVQKSFRSEGLLIAPSAQVIDWTGTPNQRAPASNYYYIGSLAVGAAISVIIFLIMGIVKIAESMRRRLV